MRLASLCSIRGCVYFGWSVCPSHFGKKDEDDKGQVFEKLMKKNKTKIVSAAFFNVPGFSYGLKKVCSSCDWLTMSSLHLIVLMLFFIAFIGYSGS